MPVWIILISQGDASLDSGYQSQLDGVTAGGPSRHNGTRYGTPDVSPLIKSRCVPLALGKPKKEAQAPKKQTRRDRAMQAALVVFSPKSFLNTGTNGRIRISMV